MYKHSRNYENVNKMLFDGKGVYDIPELRPTHYEGTEFIGFNYAKSCSHPGTKGIHFFLDDYQFLRLWNTVDRYIEILKQFQYVMTPDFSLYTDFPKALQIYNHYRKHWLGAYMQLHGIQVIPTISWSDKDSYDWCFDGEPENSCIAISSVGTQMGKESRKNFLEGYNECFKRLKPTQVIMYGKVPEGCGGNIIQVNPFANRFTERKL